MGTQLTSIVLCCLTLTTVAVAQNWSPCSKSCGGGLKNRRRCRWGSICSTSYQKCNTQPCISGWGIWQPCSKTCGGGTRFKVNPCWLNSIEHCPKTYGDCNTESCPSLPNGCPTGYKYRYRDLSSCCKIVTGNCGQDTGSSRRIISGEDAKLGQWPWMVAIVDKAKHRISCGGSLLNQQWVLSAAHCKRATEELYALLGSVTIKNPDQNHKRREIESFKAHEDYQHPINDIALVKLKTKVVYTADIKPICLPTGEMVPLDTNCVATGWGITHNGTHTNRLQQVKLRVIPLEACIQAYENRGDSAAKNMTKYQHLCIGDLSGVRDTCDGDSGGPVLCQRCSNCGWYTAGIASFGPTRCGVAGVPGVYTNVYYFQYWIRKFITLPSSGYFVC